MFIRNQVIILKVHHKTRVLLLVFLSIGNFDTLSIKDNKKPVPRILNLSLF